MPRDFSGSEFDRLAATLNEMLERIGIILAALDDATDIEEMNRPSFKLHKLKGDWKGFYAVTVRANWRIVFRFEDGRSSDVDFVDYH